MGQAKIRRDNGVLANLELKTAQDIQTVTKDMAPDIAKVVVGALSEIKKRSFGDRNPSLGKMFRCPVCRLRHRDPRCEIKYVGDSDDRSSVPEQVIGAIDRAGETNTGGANE